MRACQIDDFWTAAYKALSWAAMSDIMTPPAKPGPSKPGPTPRRAGRRAMLLDEAARQINERGAAALNLNHIAETVGLTRNALYYYVSDTNDLIFRCYLRSCETMEEDLDAAIEDHGSATARLSAFVTRTFDRQPPLAVLADLDFLPDPQRTTIADLARRRVETLAQIIAEGSDAGEFRSVNARIAAECLLGMMNWAQLAQLWLAFDDAMGDRARIAQTILDTLLHGFAADPEAAFTCPLHVENLERRSINAFDKAQAGEEKTRQLIDAASRLFNRRGCDGVSLDDIGASLGATKGAFYHYFDDKTGFIARCYERAFDRYRHFALTAGEIGSNGFEKSLIVMHLNCQAQAGGAPPMMPQPGLFTLPDQTRTDLMAQAQHIWSICQDYVAEGLADGSCRAISVADVTMVSAGAFFWLPKWLPAVGASDPVMLADQICNIMYQGLSAR